MNPSVSRYNFAGGAGPVSYSGSASPTGVEASGSTTVGNPDGNHVGAGVGFSASREETVSTSGGFTTATVTGEVSFNAEASATLGRWGVGAGVEFSTTQTQTVRVPEDMWGPIESGAVPYPNQYDPFSIPPGGSVTVNSEDARGTEVNASYGGFAVSSGLERTDGVSVQVERVNNDIVRVTSGPTATFEATDGVSVDVGVVSANAGVSRTLESAQLNTVEFNVSTPEGRAAYDAYIATGQLPAPGTAGVVDVTQTRRLTYEQSVELGISVFGLDFTHESEGPSAETVLTTHQDGSSDQVSRVDGTGYTIEATSHFQPGAERADSVTYTMELENVSPELVGSLNQVYGDRQVPEDAQNVTLTFTSEDMEEIQALARDQLIEANQTVYATREEAEAAVDEALEAHARGEPLPDGMEADPLWLEIAAAESPDVVAQNIARLVENDGPSGFIYEVTALAAQTGRLGSGLPFEYSPEG